MSDIRECLKRQKQAITEATTEVNLKKALDEWVKETEKAQKDLEKITKSLGKRYSAVKAILHGPEFKGNKAAMDTMDVLVETLDALSWAHKKLLTSRLRNSGVDKIMAANESTDTTGEPILEAALLERETVSKRIDLIKNIFAKYEKTYMADFKKGVVQLEKHFKAFQKAKTAAQMYSAYTDLQMALMDLSSAAVLEERITKDRISYFLGEMIKAEEAGEE